MSGADDSEVVVVLFAIFHACLHLSPIVHHTQHLVEDGKLRGGGEEAWLGQMSFELAGASSFDSTLRPNYSHNTKTPLQFELK